MERVFNNISDTEQELIVTLSRQEVEPIVSKSFQDIAKKVHLDGFRPGKVPMHLVKKMYGESIEIDEHTKLAQKYMEQIFNDDKVMPVSQPHLHDIIKKDGGIEFSLHYEYIPPFELGDYKTMTIDEPSHSVTDQEIEEHIQRVCYSNGTAIEAEMIEDSNFLVSFVEQESYEKYISDSANDPEKFKIDRMFLRRSNLFPELVDKFIGKKVGDVVVWDTPEQVLAENPNAPKSSNYEIKKIERVEPGELNEEFVKKLSKGKFTNSEDFKEDLGLSLQAAWDQKATEILENNIVTKLLEMHDIKIPKSVILDEAKGQIESIAKERKIPGLKFEVLKEEDQAEYLRRAEQTIKFSLIRDKIIEIEAIEVEDHDIDSFIDKMFNNMPNLDSQRDVFKNMIRENKNIINQIIGAKVMDLIKDFTTTIEVEFVDSALSFNDDFVDDFDEDEEEDIFDADEEFIDVDEFDDEFFEGEDVDSEDDEWDDEDELQEEDDDEEDEYDDDDDASPKK